MSGYLVVKNNGEHQNLFMVKNADPTSACAEVNQWMYEENETNATALAPIGDATLEHFKVVAGEPWLYATVHTASGKITNSLFSDDGGRGVLR